MSKCQGIFISLHLPISKTGFLLILRAGIPHILILIRLNTYCFYFYCRDAEVMRDKQKKKEEAAAAAQQQKK